MLPGLAPHPWVLGVQAVLDVGAVLPRQCPLHSYTLTATVSLSVVVVSAQQCQLCGHLPPPPTRLLRLSNPHPANCHILAVLPPTLKSPKALPLHHLAWTPQLPLKPLCPHVRPGLYKISSLQATIPKIESEFSLACWDPPRAFQGLLYQMKLKFPQGF